MGVDSTVSALDGADSMYFCDVVNDLANKRRLPMVLVILLVLALFVIQTLLPARFRQRPEPGRRRPADGGPGTA